MIFAESKRILLRDLTWDDVPVMVDLFNDWGVVKWMAMDPYPYTEKDGEALWERAKQAYDAKDPFYFVIATKEDGALIGGLGLRPAEDGEDGHLKLFYWLGRSFWRAGYGTEAVRAALGIAFRDKKAALVSAAVDPSNMASQALLKETGFTCLRVEKRNRAACLRGSDDVMIWALSKEAYGGEAF